MSNKQVTRITESKLNQIIKESVERVLNEGNFLNNLQGALQGAYNGWQARKGANDTFHLQSPEYSQGSQNNEKIAANINM